MIMYGQYLGYKVIVSNYYYETFMSVALSSIPICCKTPNIALWYHLGALQLLDPQLQKEFTEHTKQEKRCGYLFSSTNLVLNLQINSDCHEKTQTSPV